MVITATYSSWIPSTFFHRKHHETGHGHIHVLDPLPPECGSTKSCASEDRAPPIKSASEQDLMCSDIQTERKINPRDPTVQTPWSAHTRIVLDHSRGCILRRATTQFEQDRVSEAHTDDDLGLRLAPRTNAPHRSATGINDPSPSYRFRFNPVGTSTSAHHGARRDATPAPHVNRLCKNGGIRLWSNCSRSITI